MAFNLVKNATYIQSFDASNAIGADEDIYFAKSQTDFYLTLLLGGEVAIPAGNIADSSSFRRVFLDFYTRKPSTFRMPVNEDWRPISVILENELADYGDFLRHYIRMFDQPDVIKAHLGDADTEKMRYWIDCYLSENFQALDDISSGFGTYAELIRTQVDKQSGVGERGLVRKMPIAEAVIEWIDGLPIAMRHWDRVVLIRKTIEKLSGTLERPDLRSSWYKCQDQFEDGWSLARLWIDEAFGQLMHTRFEILERSGESHSYPHKSGSDYNQDEMIFRKSIDGNLIPGQDEKSEDYDQFVGLGTDFFMEDLDIDALAKMVWTIVEEPEFHRRTRYIRRALSEPDPDPHLLRDTVAEHIEFLASRMAGFQIKETVSGYLFYEEKTNPIVSAVTGGLGAAGGAWAGLAFATSGLWFPALVAAGVGMSTSAAPPLIHAWQRKHADRLTKDVRNQISSTSIGRRFLHPQLPKGAMKQLVQSPG